MKTHRIVSVTLCIVMGFALTAFAARVANAPNPSNLVVSNVTSDSITISWTSGGGTTDGFIVAYLEGDTFPAAQCTTGTQVNVGMNTSFVLDNLAADTTVSFRVCAYNSKNKRSTGITVQGTTLGGGPAEPGITWDPDEVATSESDQTDTISVVLDSQPTSDVVILVASSNEAEAIASPDTLTFTAQNWDQQQTVVVTGVDDNVIDGSVDYFIDMIVAPDVGLDPGYAALDPISILGRNADNDGVVTAFSNDTPLAIKDYHPVHSATPTISQVDFAYSEAWKRYVKTIQVEVSISHDDMSQLSVWLVSPLNTECQLQYDGVQWVLTDPDTFRGEDIAGVWTLEVTDHVKRTVGTLDGWSITVTPRNRSYVFKVEDGLTFRVEVHRYGTDVGPGIFQTHGGGFIFGSRLSRVERVIEDLLDDGFVVMSVDYRLAPESKMDAAWDDISDGYQWVLNNGPSLFHLDPNRVAVYGCSAGAFYAQLGGYRLFPRPKAVVSFYGGNDLLSPWTMEPAHLGWVIDEEEALAAVGYEPLVDGGCDPPYERDIYYGLCRKQAILPYEVTGLDPVLDAAIYDALYCPFRNVTADYPPTILIHCTGDPDVPVVQSYNMMGALEAKSVPRDMVIVEADTHVLYGNADPADVEAAYLRIRSFLDIHVKQAP